MKAKAIEKHVIPNNKPLSTSQLCGNAPAFKPSRSVFDHIHSSQLHGDAPEFIPARLISVESHKYRPLNPQATPFIPTPGRNVLAKPFESRSVAVLEKSAARTTETDQPALSTQQTLQVTELPISITRLRVENGQFIRRPSNFLLPPPSSFSIEGGLVPSFRAAPEPFYDGGTEGSKQSHNIYMQSERELVYNWKSNRLCANGQELLEDDMTAEQEDAERAAIPRPVHHVNWLGDPVCFKSTTPPAVSLVIIMSLLNPKGLMYGSLSKDLRKTALFRNAMSTVDPVYYYGDNVETLFNASGTKLQEKVIGDVAKIYSQKGTWYTARYDTDEERPEIDDLNHFYYRDEDAVLNGWFENHGIATRRDFVQLDAAANETFGLKTKIAMLRRSSSLHRKSSLSNMSLPESVAAHRSGMHVHLTNSSEQSMVVNESPQPENKLIRHADESERNFCLPPADADWIERLELMATEAKSCESEKHSQHIREGSANSLNLTKIFSLTPDSSSQSANSFTGSSSPSEDYGASDEDEHEHLNVHVTKDNDKTSINPQVATQVPVSTHLTGFPTIFESSTLDDGIRCMSSSIFTSTSQYSSIAEVLESSPSSRVFLGNLHGARLNYAIASPPRSRLLIVEPPSSAYHRGVFDVVERWNIAAVEDCIETHDTEDTVSVSSELLLPVPPLPKFGSIGRRERRNSSTSQVFRKFSLTNNTPKNEKKSTILDKVKKGFKRLFSRQINTLH